MKMYWASDSGDRPRTIWEFEGPGPGFYYQRIDDYTIGRPSYCESIALMDKYYPRATGLPNVGLNDPAATLTDYLLET